MYQKTTWNSGDTITAEKLNNMENGIASGGVLVVNMNDSGVLDKTYSDIASAAFAVVKYDDDGGGEIPLTHMTDPVQTYYSDSMHEPIGYWVITSGFSFFSETENGQLVKSE